MNKMEYQQYLQSSHWQNRSKQMKEKYKKCQHCGAINAIFNVHHIYYGNIGNEKDEDLLVLCEKCHKKQHEKEGKLIQNDITTHILLNTKNTMNASLYYYFVKKDNGEIKGKSFWMPKKVIENEKTIKGIFFNYARANFEVKIVQIRPYYMRNLAPVEDNIVGIFGNPAALIFGEFLKELTGIFVTGIKVNKIKQIIEKYKDELDSHLILEPEKYEI